MENDADNVLSRKTPLPDLVQLELYSFFTHQYGAICWNKYMISYGGNTIWQPCSESTVISSINLTG